ncbi:MAG: glycosyl hydrolase family 17 protein [Chloroflexota bacterium]
MNKSNPNLPLGRYLHLIMFLSLIFSSAGLPTAETGIPIIFPPLLDTYSTVVSCAVSNKLDQSLTAPGLLLPNSLHPPATLRPLFVWENVAGASSYTFQVSASQNFASCEVNIIVSPSAFRLTSDLPRNTLFFWRVRANSSNGSSAWSRVRHFDSPNPPSKPVLVSPTDRAVMVGPEPLLDWPDSIFNPQYYDVQLATDANFTSILGRGQSGRTQFSQHMPEVVLPSGTYYWRVRAVNAQSQFSEWSRPRSLLTSVHGLDFGPFYKTGEDPNRGSSISEDELRKRMKIFAPYIKWVRTFGCGNGLEKAGQIAHELNLKIAMNAWLGPETSLEEQDANRQQIDCLKARIQANEVDIAIVGSEVLKRGNLTPPQLVAYINEVKGVASPLGIEVTTADTYAQLKDQPTVISAVDIVFVNYYPFWEGIALDQAITTLKAWHVDLTTRVGGKPIIVSETGWPSCGNPKGSAVPSKANARTYLLDFVSWANATNVEYFYFEAFDEGWKVNYGDDGLFGVGPCWGIWDKNGVLK